MLILGIETSCDETSASLIEATADKINILSNVVSSQVKLHAEFGGVVPSLAAREHVKNIGQVLNSAMTSYKIENVDLIAVTCGPGLISSLLVGTAFAKTLAWKYKKPIIGVNHLEGHIVSNFLPETGGITNHKLQITKKDNFPILCLVVSGGHTELVLTNTLGTYKKIGQTLDDAAGEAFDKIARILELEYPGGPAISAVAEIAGPPASVLSNNAPISLPRPMLKSPNFDFSFSGLKTAVLYLVRDLKKQNNEDQLSKKTTAQIAAEAQQAIIDVLVSKTISAAKKFEAKTILLAGGVSANKLLRSEMKKTAETNGLIFSCPPMEYTTDNAAMIALAGFLNYDKTQRYPWNNFEANANLSI